MSGQKIGGAGKWLKIAGTAAAAGVGAALVWQQAEKQKRAIDLSGKIVLLTGGSRGLGLVLARKLAQMGAKIALCAREADELARAKDNILQAVPGFAPDDVLLLAADVTDTNAVARVVETVTQTWGAVDVLINNAGTIQVGPMETMTPQDYDDALKLHFWAPFHLIHAVLPAMKARRSGRIVNISSIGGKIAIPHLLPYSTSKFALVGFSEGLRSELMKDKVFVTTVCPGLIRTGSPANALFKGQHRKEYAWFAVGDSLPGLSQSAEACADAIIDALRHGNAEIITSLPAQTAAVFHGVFPGLTSDLMGQVNRLLPRPDGAESIGTQKRTGRESKSPLAPTALTALSDVAATRNNE